jgi:hypothetical protein
MALLIIGMRRPSEKMEMHVVWKEKIINMILLTIGNIPTYTYHPYWLFHPFFSFFCIVVKTET